MPSNPLGSMFALENMLIIHDVRMLLLCTISSSLSSSLHIRQSLLRRQRVHDHEILAVQDAELAQARDQSVEVSRLHVSTTDRRKSRHFRQIHTALPPSSPTIKISAPRVRQRSQTT